MLYHPTEGEVYMKKVLLRPRTCFLMTKIGDEVPEQISQIRRSLSRQLKKVNIELIDANSIITGGDFLIKIWELIISVPLGIAILTEELSSETKSNIFFELGILKTLGKAALVIKTKECKIPSDFIRTEYINYNNKFRYTFKKYLNNFLNQALHYNTMSSELGKNPLVSIDYLKRASLIGHDNSIEEKLTLKINQFLEMINLDDDLKKEINLILRQ